MGLTDNLYWMRKPLAIIVALILSGCGREPDRLPNYHTGFGTSPAGASKVSVTYCYEVRQKSPTDEYIALGYHRITYADGDSLVRCMVSDTSYHFGDSAYYASTSGIKDGSCNITLTGSETASGAWSYSVTGTTVSTSVSGASTSLNGWALTLSSCYSE